MIGSENLYDADMRCVFSKTFGRYSQCEAVLDAISEMESIAESIFLYPRVQGLADVSLGNIRYSLYIPEYEQNEEEQRILELAKDVDAAMEAGGIMPEKVDSNKMTYEELVEQLDDSDNYQ